ncbi:tail fiber assembly protein [Xenorhabdus sp. TS4]|uniref:tail fiber assembly protein n=1 Tax=Xenorhabdus sp. TS4 TaxID=1873483 RepID=UPI001656DCCE|nr:tail fiber assembly protein [Xenorhabdus sp. TS4]MBC8949209.1 phage tail fiber assembly [Xenorhabdus sp. TS4]
MSLNSYLFSPSTLGFYPVSWIADYRAAGTLPDDVIPVADAVFLEFSQSKSGKLRGADSYGMPCWVDIPPPPPPTPAELQQRAESQKRYLMSQAANAIAPLQYAVDLRMETDNERAALIAWKKYTVLLNRVDCSTAPNIDWPKAPE